ncbi:UNVERIFIED_CONTAM: hypothetical protein BEN50_15455 [Euhalothece sp. KZN 001]
MCLVTALPVSAQGNNNQTHIISGQIRINKPIYLREGGNCDPEKYEGLENLVTGNVSLTVENGKREIIAIQELESGKYQYQTGGLFVNFFTNKPAICVVKIPEFQVPDANFYSFKIPGKREVNYSKQQLQEMGWNLELMIGY